MEILTLNSRAKINIGLNIIRKRKDGYHDLETIFYPINLFDIISFRKSSKFEFQCSDPQLNSAADNLIIKAKNKIEELSRKRLDVEIELKKKIPLGAGLGGGSSNAAFTLKGLNDLFELKIPLPDLMKAALELGSDVPFFFLTKPCFAWSRGEMMEEIDFHISNPILIVNPGIHVSTKWAFENIIPHPPKNSLKDLIKEKDPYKLREIATNDFENPVFDCYPEIRDIKEKLYSSGALFASMSGSGSTVYGIFSSHSEAENAKALFKKEYLTFIHNENL